MLADEDAVFEAYGFKAVEEEATAAAAEEVPIPSKWNYTACCGSSDECCIKRIGALEGHKRG